MRVFFVVLARNASAVDRKMRELTRLGYPYVIICGEPVDHPNVVHREPRGKFDAINFGLSLVPFGIDVVAFNDVDAEIHGFETALRTLESSDAALTFVRVDVQSGPQLSFYSFLDALRRWIPIAASGELMLVRYEFLKRMLPLKGCKAEDSLILFKALELGGKVAFCEECYVTTKRTESAEQEEAYKRRTVGGIYQALSFSKPPFMVRLFYLALPFVSPLLLVSGKKGYYWSKGILLGFVDYLRGDRKGSWKPTYV